MAIKARKYLYERLEHPQDEVMQEVRRRSLSKIKNQYEQLHEIWIAEKRWREEMIYEYEDDITAKEIIGDLEDIALGAIIQIRINSGVDKDGVNIRGAILEYALSHFDIDQPDLNDEYFFRIIKHISNDKKRRWNDGSVWREETSEVGRNFTNKNSLSLDGTPIEVRTIRQ